MSLLCLKVRTESYFTGSVSDLRSLLSTFSITEKFKTFLEIALIIPKSGCAAGESC